MRDHLFVWFQKEGQIGTVTMARGPSLEQVRADTDDPIILERKPDEIYTPPLFFTEQDWKRVEHAFEGLAAKYGGGEVKGSLSDAKPN